MTKVWEELDGIASEAFGGPTAVYIFHDHRGKPKYVGSSDRVWGRIGDKHVSGSDSHAVQRAYSKVIPDRELRRAFICKHLRVSFIIQNSPEEAKRLETELIRKYKPAWNISDIPGKTKNSSGVYEDFDEALMRPYVR